MLFGRVISVGIGYLCGMFLSGFLYGKKENVDLRKVGSGNVGTTNTMRNLGQCEGLRALCWCGLHLRSRFSGLYEI